MANINLTLDIAGGGDEPYASGVVQVARVVSGDSIAGYVDGSFARIPLSNPPTVLGANGFDPLERGVTYAFILPSGLKVYLAMPAAASANFSDLVPLIPVPPGPDLTYTQGQIDTKLAEKAASAPLPGFQPRLGKFDPATGVYTPAGCRGLPKFNSHLAKVRTGSSTVRAQIALAGHSLMAGYTSSVGTYDPGSVLRKMLSQSLGVKAGSGLIPTFNGDAVGFTDDSRYSKSGTFIWLGSAGNLVPWAYGSTPNCSVTHTSNTPGTVVDILASDGFGNLTYTIDGTPGTITVGGTSAYKLTTVTGLPDTNHTVTVTSAAGTEILVGVNVRYPSDLEVHDFGIVGTSAADWVGTTNYASSLGTIVGMAPSCVAIMLGHAEIQAGTSIATYKANLQTMITAFKAAGSDIVLIGAIPLDTYSDAQWLPYREALYDLADTNSCLLVDPYPFFGTYAGGVALGLYQGTDIAHLTNAGNAELMRLVAGAFTQGTGGADVTVLAPKASPTFTGTNTTDMMVYNRLTEVPSSKTATATLTITSNKVQLCDATSGAISITPTATTTPGVVYLIKKTDSSVNPVTVVGTIDGQTNVVLDSQYDYVEIVTTAVSGTFLLIRTNVASASLQTPKWLNSRYYESQYVGFNIANNTLTAGTVYYVPITIPRGTTITEVAINVTTAVAATAIHIGLYANGAGGPGALIRNFGNVASTSSGNKSLTALAQPVAGGMYWLGLMALGGAPGISCHAGANTGVSAWIGAGAIAETQRAGWNQTGQASLPATPSSLVTSTDARPRIQLKPA